MVWSQINKYKYLCCCFAFAFRTIWCHTINSNQLQSRSLVQHVCHSIAQHNKVLSSLLQGLMNKPCQMTEQTLQPCAVSKTLGLPSTLAAFQP